MNKSAKKPRNEEMYKAILKLQTVEEALNFFDDLCTVPELLAMEQRFNVSFEDIEYVAYPALRHRLVLSFDAVSEGITADDVIRNILQS